MRLQLAVLLVSIAATARGDTGFVSKVQLYADSDHTTVISPLVQGTADVAPDTTVTLGYVADVVTSASVDIVSQASPTTIHDTRQQVSASLAQTFGSLKLHGGYSFSHENDYLSHSLNLGLDQEAFDKNTTFSLGYAVNLNTVGRRDDDNFSRSLTNQSFSLAWTQIVTPTLLTQLTYELGYANGFQSSPYRFVPIRPTLDATPEMWVMETDPDTRFRHAVVFGVNRAIGESSSIQGDYRFYHDTWGITSHTLGARLFTHLSPALELRLRERFYTQGSASFYQENYTNVEQYMAFDRELSALWSETFGVKLSYLFTPHVEGELKCDVFYFSYSEFAPLTSRTGTNTGVGLAMTY
ncbi:MAG: DUF3570 domain-containing protein [Kofleriaceae bacterium]